MVILYPVSIVLISADLQIRLWTGIPGTKWRYTSSYFE